MSKKARGLLFILFVSGFLISAPIVVLYTAGYRFSFTSNKIVKTGILSIATLPKGAEVYVDNKLQKDQTPLIASDVIPGDHEVRVEKDGYFAWVKTLAVEENKTTFVKDIVLYLDSPPLFRAEGEFLKATRDRSASRIAYIKYEESWLEIRTSAIQEETDSLVSRIPLIDLKDVSLNWSMNGKYLLVREIYSNKDKFVVVGSSGDIRVDTGEYVKNAEHAYWDPYNEEYLYLQTADGVFLLDLYLKQASDISDEPVLSLKKGGEIIRFEKVGGTIEIIKTFEDETEQTVAVIPGGDYEFLPSPQSFFLLKDKSSDRLLLIDSGGSDQPILLNERADHISWSPLNNSQLLLATEFEIRVYDAGVHNDQLITRVSQPISDIIWHPGGSSLIYSVPGEVLAIELDRRDRRNVFTLAKMNEIASLWIGEKGKVLYVLGTVEDSRGIFAREIRK